jgi:hypothetical protein
MNAKTLQRCREVVAPSLAPGEQITAVEVAQIGKVSPKKQAGAVGVGVVVGVATGGFVPPHPVQHQGPASVRTTSPW